MVLLLAPIIIGVVAYLAWRNRAVRGCRWRADTQGNKGALRMYRCAACGAEAFTASKGPPDSCKKGLGKSSL
ncbi:hypothetical protein [uncultured Sulfitobacter sp.]|uniref:hypothetical protein n=1 Tax=uncultured Sulfitobacter sp. TaxID=191468 RepID=UPI00261B8C3D|nr:hypothetical protein [uncultured Sulfitobacter sp.]